MCLLELHYLIAEKIFRSFRQTHFLAETTFAYVPLGSIKIFSH